MDIEVFKEYLEIYHPNVADRFKSWIKENPELAKYIDMMIKTKDLALKIEDLPEMFKVKEKTILKSGLKELDGILSDFFKQVVKESGIDISKWRYTVE